MTLRAPLRMLTAVVAVAALALSVSGCDGEDGDGGAKADAGSNPASAGGAASSGGTEGTTGATAESSTGGSATSAGSAGNPGRNGGASGGPEARQKMMLDNMPKAGMVMAAGEYVQRFTTCERYSIDPSDERYYPMDEKFDETWGVQFRGTCDDGGHGYIRVFKTSDMKKFQTAYKADVAERMKKNELAAIKGGFAIGKDFAVIAPDERTIRDLSSSGLLILNCNPNFQPVGDVSTAPALVEGCVLTDEFVS